MRCLFILAEMFEKPRSETRCVRTRKFCSSNYFFSSTENQNLEVNKIDEIFDEILKKSSKLVRF